MEIAETTEENLCKRKVEYVNPDGNEFYLKRNLEKKLLSGRSAGKPFKYLTYDKESESYIYDEEIKIPNGSLFHALREDGRLKLYMHFLDEE
ncbi:hypothetical protein JHK82_027704 [Glycine max]|nr:hypothetical protein JHK82_027704 [Glycine max]